MSVDYKLYIPPHVKYDFLILLSAKLLADKNLRVAEFRPSDKTKPASPDNPWYYAYRPEVQTLDDTIGFSVITFNALGSDNSMRINFHTDHSCDLAVLQGYKLMTGGSGALQLALARKIIDCVGGLVFYQDCGHMDMKHKTEYHRVTKPRLPKSFFLGETDEQFYDTANFIDNTAHLSLKDVLAQRKNAYYPLEEDYTGDMEKLDIKMEQKKLSREITASSVPAKTHKV